VREALVIAEDAVEAGTDVETIVPRIVRAGSDPLDVVRAACAAVWAHADRESRRRVDPAPVLAALYALEEAGPWGR
jgi:hypothetical protein